MSDLIPFNESGGLIRDSRRAGRAISRSRAYTQVRLARIDDEVDVTIQKVDALTSATGMAMAATTKVAQAQHQLEALSPEVSGRLEYLATSHLLAVGDALQELRRHLRNK